MFGFFGKKKAPTGPTGPDLHAAIQYAYSDLLGEVVDRAEVAQIANGLNNGPMSYKTEELALATALNFFRRDELREELRFVQLQARLKMIEWLQSGKVKPFFAQTFENSLYERFK